MTSHRIHDMPEDDRPRERLLRLGPGALSDAELLAIFINTGIKGENAMQVGQRLLREYGSLRNLSRIGAGQLASAKALGPAKAAHLAAAFELGRRAEQERLKDVSLNEPELIYNYLGAEMQALAHESLRVLLLNTKMCIVNRAYAFVVVHNHPSGDPTPSEADRRITRQLKEGSEILSLVFMDHIIIGTPTVQRPRGYFSFKAQGLL